MTAVVPTISIDNVAGLEVDSGTTNFVFTVSLDSPSTATVTVDYITGDNTATLADNDYIANAGTLTFSPGEISQTVTVQLVGKPPLK